MKKIIGSKPFWIGLFTVFAMIATFQAFDFSTGPVEDPTETFTEYNNYVIFKQSFVHLQEGKDLYVKYPHEHWDLYKYTPTFSVFFGFFSLFPDGVGLGLWNILNAVILVFAVFAIPKLTNIQKGLALFVLMIEMITSIQNEQSNGLMAGLIILGFVFLEKRNYAVATLLIICTIFIKLFGIVALVLFLFYPKKWKLAAYSALWVLVLFIIPLLFVDFNQYLNLWESFGNMLSNDHSESYGYSVMGIINTWSGMEINKNVIVLIGILLFMLPFIRLKAYSESRFRILALVSVLLWVVIFNHKAESPTFVIAMAGIGLWFVLSKKRPIHIVIVCFAFILTSLSATDVFPRDVRNDFIKPFAMKALPSIIVWSMVIYEMLLGIKPNGQNELIDPDKKEVLTD